MQPGGKVSKGWERQAEFRVEAENQHSNAGIPGARGYQKAANPSSATSVTARSQNQQLSKPLGPSCPSSLISQTLTEDLQREGGTAKENSHCQKQGFPILHPVLQELLAAWPRSPGTLGHSDHHRGPKYQDTAGPPEGKPIIIPTSAS